MCGGLGGWYAREVKFPGLQSQRGLIFWWGAFWKFSFLTCRMETMPVDYCENWMRCINVSG